MKQLEKCDWYVTKHTTPDKKKTMKTTVISPVVGFEGKNLIVMIQPGQVRMTTWVVNRDPAGSDTPVSGESETKLISIGQEGKQVIQGFLDDIIWNEGHPSKDGNYFVQCFAYDAENNQSQPEDLQLVVELPKPEPKTEPAQAATKPNEDAKAKDVPTATALSAEDVTALNTTPARLNKIRRDLNQLPSNRVETWEMLKDMLAGLAQILDMLIRFQVFGDKPYQEKISLLIDEAKALQNEVEKTRSLKSDKWNKTLKPRLHRIKDLLEEMGYQAGQPGEVSFHELATMMAIVNRDKPAMTMEDVENLIVASGKLLADVQKIKASLPPKPAPATPATPATATAPAAGQPATTGAALAGAIPPVGQPTPGQPAAASAATTPWYVRYKMRIIVASVGLTVLSLIAFGLLAWFFLKPALARMATHNPPPAGVTDTNMVAIVSGLRQQLAAVQESLRRATNHVVAHTNAATPQAQKVEEAKEALKQLSNLDSKVTSRPQWCTNVTYLPPNTLVDHTCNYTNRGTVGPGDFVIIDPPSGWAANYWVSDPNSLESRQEGLPASLSLGREPAPYAGKENATFWLKPGASPVTYEVTFYRYR